MSVYVAARKSGLGPHEAINRVPSVVDAKQDWKAELPNRFARLAEPRPITVQPTLAVTDVVGHSDYIDKGGGSIGCFAALKSDGSVICWGNHTDVNDYFQIRRLLTFGVKQLLTDNVGAFAALKEDGSVISWGANPSGSKRSRIPANVSSKLASGVKKLYSNGQSFAAIKLDGSLVAWGSDKWGGNISEVASDLSSGVRELFASDYAYAALKEDGSVVTWGYANTKDDKSLSNKLSSGVKTVFAAGPGFVAVKDDGDVVAWGSLASGISDFRSIVSADIKQLACTPYLCAALRPDGSVITWELPGFKQGKGGEAFIHPQLKSGVVRIINGHGNSLGALKDDGSVVVWGRQQGDRPLDPHFGTDIAAVTKELSSGVKDLISSGNSFVAIKDDGSVVSWGAGVDTAKVSPTLTSGVQKVYVADRGGFAALKEDGSLILWGGQFTKRTKVDPFLIDNIKFDEQIEGEVITASPLPAAAKGLKLFAIPSEGYVLLMPNGTCFVWGLHGWGERFIDAPADITGHRE